MKKFSRQGSNAWMGHTEAVAMEYYRQTGKAANKLRTAATETVKAADWIAGNYSCESNVSVNNARGFVADMAVFNYR